MAIIFYIYSIFYLFLFHLLICCVCQHFDSVPYILTQWAFSFFLVGPFVYAVRVVSMVTGPPGDRAITFIYFLFICMTLKTSFIDAIFTNSTVLHCYIPTPQSHCVPLLNLDPFIHLHLNFCIFNYQSFSIYYCLNPSKYRNFSLWFYS